MTPLLQVLLGVAEPGLASSPLLTPNYRRLAEEFGRQPVLISTGRSATKAEMLVRFGHDLALPDWFGHNLDAAHEALHDRLADQPDTLVVLEAPSGGPDGDDTDAVAFIDVVHGVHVERGLSGLLVGNRALGLLQQVTA